MVVLINSFCDSLDCDFGQVMSSFFASVSLLGYTGHGVKYIQELNSKIHKP